ncbi:hypothetical protein [Paraburkholderia phytofirmans]|uniref:hypothetical protein n=1 Tax=Paraburkholderia phytofirmans TaxID=261302 RepID=UPI0038BAEC80
MMRKTLNASRLQQEVDRRIHRLQPIVEDVVKAVRAKYNLSTEVKETGNPFGD